MTSVTRGRGNPVMIPALTTAQLAQSLRAAAQAESDAHHAEQLRRWVR